MGYLVQKTRAAQLLIGGQDYTSSLVEWSVSDAGAFKKGLMTTQGSLILGQRPGGADIQDYNRNAFKRGTVVTLDMENGDGTTYRHPRGYLYVIGVAYETESEQLVVELGCRLSLAYLTDNADAILPLVPIHLDPAQQTVQNCSASFASAGMVLYQDNQGALVSRKFFGTDSTAGIEAGEWVSVLGESTLAVTPLAGASAIPDEIDLAYQVPEGVLADDNLGLIETTRETSNYFFNYPATIWVRNPNPVPTGERQLPDKVTTSPGSPGRPASGCGQVPTPPRPGNVTITPGGTENYYLCSDRWTTDRTNVYLPATRVAISTTTYGGPAAQVSRTEQVVYGPEVEANPGYFADKYAYCVSTYGYACNPQGSCPYYGLGTRMLQKQVTSYFYGAEANELVKTVQDTYDTILSAYTTDEYRSGITNGQPQDFNGDLTAGPMYRSQRVVTDYYQEDNTNVQLTTTYTSVASRGVGPSSGKSLDALQGIITTVKRESTTTTTLDIRPDTVNSSTTSTTEQKTIIPLDPNTYISPPSEAGKYVLEESIPVPLLSEDIDEIKGWVNDYANYLKRFVKGDTYGLQIAESMRPEIVENWYPGMPFRYADTANDVISAMRMDACSWGVTQNEALVVTNGVWNGFSSGTLQLGSNLVGNSKPDMTRPTPENPNPIPNPTPPTPVSGPPEIINVVVGESFSFIV